MTAPNLGRRGFGFEIKKEFYEKARDVMLRSFQPTFGFMSLLFVAAASTLAACAGAAGVSHEAP